MSSGLNINYKALDDIILNLNSIATDGEADVNQLIMALSDSFSGSNSGTTQALMEIKLQYKEVNNLLTSLALYSANMIEKAKILYQDTDSESAKSISKG